MSEQRAERGSPSQSPSQSAKALCGKNHQVSIKYMAHREQGTLGTFAPLNPSKPCAPEGTAANPDEGRHRRDSEGHYRPESRPLEVQDSMLNR